MGSLPLQSGVPLAVPAFVSYRWQRSALPVSDPRRPPPGATRACNDASEYAGAWPDPLPGHRASVGAHETQFARSSARGRRSGLPDTSLERHVVFVAGDEVVFLFEGPHAEEVAGLSRRVRRELEPRKCSGLSPRWRRWASGAPRTRTWSRRFWRPDLLSPAHALLAGISSRTSPGVRSD